MARRSARPEAAHEVILTPLKERCEQCGQFLWVAHHSHRTVAMLSGLWRMTLVVRKSYPAELSALPSALPAGGRRALGVATRRIWLGGECAALQLSISGSSHCYRDAPVST